MCVRDIKRKKKDFGLSLEKNIHWCSNDRERETRCWQKRECVWVRESVCVSEWERESVCNRESEWEKGKKKFMNVFVGEGKWLLVRDRKNGSCVKERMREREKERERERKREREKVRKWVR